MVTVDAPCDPDNPAETLHSLSGRTTSAAGSEAIRKRLLYDWNETHAEFPQECVHTLFEEQVTRTPDAVAVVGGERSFTYWELNARANQVANYLRRRGVGPETLTGVCLQRTPDMLAALLGVWKAGGAYVPLDPSYPQERLAFMAEDSAAAVLITEERHTRLFPLHRDKMVRLDSDWHLIASEDNGNIDSGTNLSNLAYVIYTSGSTGRPKGAMILQRGLVNYLWWAIRYYGFQVGGSVPVHSSISFDLTVTSLYPPLLVGGQVEMLVDDFGGQGLLAALRGATERNVVKLTPAHLAALTLQLSASELDGKASVFVIGGENLLAEGLRPWRESARATRLINEYGPTEAVVGCCVYEVRPGDPNDGSVPIGRPIANTQIYILNEGLQPVLPGVTGELYVGGAGVARGYLNRQDLTKERFLPDPFGLDENATIYKTGDLGRYREDGIIEYLGRADDQVKIRGYRVELGEVEMVLAGCPGVQSAAVLVGEEEGADRVLIAFVVLRGDAERSSAELEGYLKSKIPEYMVPARIIRLTSFPLTLNGKVDRKALLAISQEFIDRNSAQPRNETERVLVHLWKEILKIENVGIDDDFFELGGHSLKAIRLASRIRDRFGVDLPAQELFENSTIAAVAELLSDALVKTEIRI